MTTSNQLLPCPFCGGTDVHMRELGIVHIERFAQCYTCELSVPLDSWNRRATQPAAGEPKPIGYISEAVHQELLNGKHVPANICTATPSRRNPHPGPDANWSVPIYAAPPAAAHGDEAVRKDAARYQWLRNRLPGSAYRFEGIVYSEGGEGVDKAIDAAIRAQGDGGSGDA